MVKLELSLNIGRKQKSETKASTAEDVQTAPPQQQVKRKLGKKKFVLILAILSLILLAGSGFAYWRFIIWKPAVVNPFTAKIMASVQFPLYYPTKLPEGYRVDTKSVTVPQQGVVVFNIIGPHGATLYMSEEARPQSFDLGGFYNNLQDLKEIGISDGAVAVGRKEGQEIASRANSKTWILSNTTAHIPPDQLTGMMKSLTLSY